MEPHETPRKPAPGTPAPEPAAAPSPGPAPEVPGPAATVPQDGMEPSPEAVRAQVERILTSAAFAAADRAKKFLRYVVEETLAGRQDRLKEYTLAVAVFDRDASFDPATNPSVRVEISRLRRKLEHYYLTTGREDPVLIDLPRGTYVPVFQWHADVLHLGDGISSMAAAAPAEQLSAEGLQGPSIAILPFASTGDEDERLLGDGITVEIITALSRFRNFHVVGRNTTFRYRQQEDAVQVGRLLGVRYVLKGTVRRADQRVRINAELASGATGKVLWAERYERDLNVASVFEIQDDIAVHVVSTIAQSDGAILLPERVLVRRKPLERLDTYECLLVFYDYTSEISPARHARAVEALERAHRMEPDSSAIWAARAHVYLDMYRFGFNVTGSPAEALKTALRAAQTAVDLDPLNPSAYHALFAARYAHGDRKGFREAAGRAIELNPINTDILASYGLHLILSDEFELGHVFMKLALALNPEPPDWYWFAFYSLHSARGEHEEALDMALRVQTEDFYWTHCMRAASYAMLGMKAEAAESIRCLLALYPDFARHAAEEVARWTSPARVERALSALHAAGLPKV